MTAPVTRSRSTKWNGFRSEEWLTSNTTPLRLDLLHWVWYGPQPLEIAGDLECHLAASEPRSVVLLMLRSFLCVLVILQSLAGPRLCCFLTSQLHPLQPSTAMSHTPVRKCGCCSCKPAKNSQPQPDQEQPACPCQQWPMHPTFMACPMESSKSMLLLGDDQPHIAYPPQADLALSICGIPNFPHSRLKSPFLTPTEILRLLRVSRC